MKYEVTYSCGHTETVQLYGKQMKENGRFPIIKNTDSALSVRKNKSRKRMKNGVCIMQYCRI